MLISNQNKENWSLVFKNLDAKKSKHVSFDFWNTIAYSNPKFKQKRALLVKEYLGLKISSNQINEGFKRVGERYNNQIECGGKTIPSLDLLRLVVKDICNDHNKDLKILTEKIETVFIENPPIIEQGFLNFLKGIDSSIITYSITSNTAFISGQVIRQFLINSNFYSNFKFVLFSDEVGIGKPSNKIFEKLIINAQKYHSEIKLDNIIHIGDNYNADFIGAQKNGIIGCYLESNPYLRNPRFAAFLISNKDEMPISKEEYSRFKFGDFNIARKYGDELFQYFMKELFYRYLEGKSDIIVYSSPYSHIPTSSYYLTQVFYENLKQYLQSHGILNINIQFKKINRCQTYIEDYGALNANDRYDLIKNDTYEFDDKPNEASFLIFLDDISITGTHQRVIEKLMLEKGYSNDCLFLYYAKLIDSTIPPSIENDLNYAHINKLDKLFELIDSDNFAITTRAVKYLLKLNKNEFNLFLISLKNNNKIGLLEEIYFYSLKNNYNKIELFNDNIVNLLNFINHNNKRTLKIKS